MPVDIHRSSAIEFFGPGTDSAYFRQVGLD